MKTWWYYLQLLKYQPVMYAINLTGIVGAFLLEMVPGLLSREYFNLLSGAAPVRFDLTTLIVLLLAGALGRMCFYILLPMTNTTFVYTFGAVQAVKIAGAEARIIRRFGPLNDQRRASGVRDKLFSELLQSIFANTVNIGTGLILLMAATSIRAKTFTIGDFALFVYYLGWI